jgi:hypothetical protein
VSLLQEPRLAIMKLPTYKSSYYKVSLQPVTLYPPYTRDENLRDIPPAKPARGILPADDFKGDKVAGIGPSGFYNVWMISHEG